MIGDAFVEAGPDRERWLLSYADLLTLLLAFFIVMYSISAVNQTKLAEVSDSINKALSDESDVAESSQSETTETFDSVNAAQLAQQITRLGYDDIKVTDTNGDWIEISLASELLFTSGQASLRTDNRAGLDGLLRLLNTVQGNIQVEGHTDDQAISTALYPSNWELSASRAAAIVRYLEQQGVPAYRLAAMGFGSSKPIDTNRTATGREKNRRVSVKIKQSQIDFEALLALRVDPLPAERMDSEANLDNINPIDEAPSVDKNKPSDEIQTDSLDEFRLEDVDPALLQEVLRELELEAL